MIHVREFSSAEEMHDHYRAVRARLMGETLPPKPVSKPIPTKIEIPPEAAELVEQFKEVEIKPRPVAEPDFAPEAGKPGARKIVAHVARKHGLTPEDILGERRHKQVIQARWEAMGMVYRANPKWGLPQIGRFFNRDHTTALHALRKMGLRS